jgi:hypothetical protein
MDKRMGDKIVYLETNNKKGNAAKNRNQNPKGRDQFLRNLQSNRIGLYLGARKESLIDENMPEIMLVQAETPTCKPKTRNKPALIIDFAAEALTRNHKLHF